ERCEHLTTHLQKSLILNVEATDVETLLDEGFDQIEAIVTATSDDKTNVLMAILAKQFKIGKIIAIVSDERYSSMLNSLGIDTVINPKNITADNIFKYLRRGQILSVSSIAGEKAEILEFVVSQDSTLVNKPLSQLKIPYGCIVGAILHNHDVIIPSGSDRISPGDRVIVFSLRSILSKVEKMFA
ncbi:NAD-binding protein, partial [candidate division CSSED10-310 bacterium]